jgi:hypothetical protein
MQQKGWASRTFWEEDDSFVDLGYHAAFLRVFQVERKTNHHDTRAGWQGKRARPIHMLGDERAHGAVFALVRMSGIEET